MPRKLDNRDDVVRQFWAIFLDAKVAKDGQVSGFRKAWDTMTQQAQEQAGRYAESCWLKIHRDRRDADDCIAAGVDALRNELAAYRPASSERGLKSAQDYARFRFSLIAGILGYGWTPLEVAQKLEVAADRFPQIGYDECRRLREMNDVWQPWSGPALSESTVEHLRSAKYAPLMARVGGQLAPLALPFENTETGPAGFETPPPMQ